MATSGRRRRCWIAAIAGCAVLLAAVAAMGCRQGRVRFAHGPGGQGPVAAVLPYELDDAAQPLPEGAVLCYADADCTAHPVRECCPGCVPTYIAINEAARSAIARFHASHPCPADVPCAEPDCVAEAVPAPTASCSGNRCTLSW